MQGEKVTDHKELNDYYDEYFTSYNEKPQSLPVLNLKYSKLFREKLKYMWPTYFRYVGRSIIWIWDKYHLFVYKDPFYPADTLLLRILNIILLGLNAIGIVNFIRRNGFFKSPPFIFSLLLMGTITFIFTLINNESRLSMPYYPLAIFWAGYGLSKIKLSLS
jgi:hypothetical protein